MNKNNFQKITILLLTVMVTILLVTSTVSANYDVKTTITGLTGGPTNGLVDGWIGITDLGGKNGLIGILIKSSVIIGGVGFFGYFLIGAIRWMMAGGDKAATLAARETITHALTGLIIIISAYAVIIVMQAVLKLNILGSITFPAP